MDVAKLSARTRYRRVSERAMVCFVDERLPARSLGTVAGAERAGRACGARQWGNRAANESVARAWRGAGGVDGSARAISTAQWRRERSRGVVADDRGRSGVHRGRCVPARRGRGAARPSRGTTGGGHRCGRVPIGLPRCFLPVRLGTSSSRSADASERGVPHYRIVDPEHELLTVHRLSAEG